MLLTLKKSLPSGNYNIATITSMFMKEMTTYTHRFLIFTVLVLIVTNSFAQIITENDGFEGIPQIGYPPEGWHNCSDGTSSCDTQPSPLFNDVKASQGKTYVSIVTREVGPPGSVETMWADLKSPLRKGQEYTFLIDVTLSNEFHGMWEWETYYFNNPCRMEVLGINLSCDQNGVFELLYQSKIIHHFYWDTYEITFTPQTTDFDRIGFRAQFTEPGNFKCSALMIDNLRYKPRNSVCYPNPATREITIDYLSYGDDEYQIWTFDYTGKLISTTTGSLYSGGNNIKVSMEHLATGMYIVEFRPLKGESEKFNIIKIRE